jgi:hypothetical protein
VSFSFAGNLIQTAFGFMMMMMYMLYISNVVRNEWMTCWSQ